MTAGVPPLMARPGDPLKTDAAPGEGHGDG